MNFFKFKLKEFKTKERTQNKLFQFHFISLVSLTPVNKHLFYLILCYILIKILEKKKFTLSSLFYIFFSLFSLFFVIKIST